MEIDMNDPRYCGACEHIHPPHEVDCRCYCDRVDCPECSRRIAERVMAPELAREIDKYYQAFEETPEDQRIAAVAEIILGHRCPMPPPEPREPEAREAAKEWLYRGGIHAQGDFSAMLKSGGEIQLDELLEAYSAELRAERGQVEAELQRVRDDREDVCNRLDTAEARVKELETADIQRAKDITRLTIERDKHRDESEFFQREMDNFRRNRDHRIVQLEAELAASRANHIDANERNMNAERSLLQARLDLKTRLERALADAKDINGYAQIGELESLLKVLGHTTGMIIRLERELASTSAPEGTV